MSWGQPRLPSQESEVSAHSNCGGSPVFIQHPLTQNDQIRHGNTYGDRRVLGQPRHCICINASRCLSAITCTTANVKKITGR